MCSLFQTIPEVLFVAAMIGLLLLFRLFFFWEEEEEKITYSPESEFI